MNRCNYCGVEIIDDTEKCPLCHGVLEGNGKGVTTYPDVTKTMRRVSFAYRLLMFLCVLGIITTGVICFVFTDNIKWGIIVDMCIVYAMWILYVAFNDRVGYRVRLLTGVAFAVILIILTDFTIGYNGWSVNFILPSAIIGIDLMIFVLMMVNRRNWQSYIIFQIGMLLICILPIILINVGIVIHPLISVIAVLVTVVEFIGTIMLGGSTAKHELRRRFHVR